MVILPCFYSHSHGIRLRFITRPGPVPTPGLAPARARTSHCPLRWTADEVGSTVVFTEVSRGWRIGRDGTRATPPYGRRGDGTWGPPRLLDRPAYPPPQTRLRFSTTHAPQRAVRIHKARCSGSTSPDAFYTTSSIAIAAARGPHHAHDCTSVEGEAGTWSGVDPLPSLLLCRPPAPDTFSYSPPRRLDRGVPHHPCLRQPCYLRGPFVSGRVRTAEPSGAHGTHRRLASLLPGRSAPAALNACRHPSGTINQAPWRHPATPPTTEGWGRSATHG